MTNLLAESANQDSPSSSFDTIQVYLRIRPFDTLPNATTTTTPFLKQTSPTRLSLETTCNQTMQNLYEFDFIQNGLEMENNGQDHVFRSVGKPISDNCLQGYNGTIFAYGQTGSGKTFTMQGPSASVSSLSEYAETGLGMMEGVGAAATGPSTTLPCTGLEFLDYDRRGLIPRCLEYLFAMMHREQHKPGSVVQYLCRASYCEIYNEAIYDLLDPSAPACLIREDLKRGVYVDGITEEWVQTPEEAYRILQIGARNRHVAATSMNRESSRSHSVFTLTIQSKITTNATSGDLSEESKGTWITDVRESRFNLVDLAGSERQKLTATTGLRLKEAGNINKSLLALGNVINALVDRAHGKPRHVHYRDSKLTFLLRDSLGGNAKTVLIAHVSPDPTSFGETVSTLRFAQRAKLIRNRAVVNREVGGDVEQLQAEIRRLRHELLLVRSQVGRAGIGGSAIGAVGEWMTGVLAELDRFDGGVPGGAPVQEGDFARFLEDADESMRLRALLALVLKRYQRTHVERTALLQRLLTMHNLVERQRQQLQSEKMVIKFRDNTVRLLRARNPDVDRLVAASTEALQAELEACQSALAHHTDAMKFAAENLELREQVAQFQRDLEAVRRFEAFREERTKFELVLGEQVVQMQATLAQSARTQRVSELESMVRDLTAELTEVKAVQCRQQEELRDSLVQLKTAKQVEMELREDHSSAQSIIKELEAALESAKLGQDIRARQRRNSTIPDFNHVSTIATNEEDVVEMLHSEVENLKNENSRLRLKYENMEKKSRRISDFAAENRNSTEESLRELNDQLHRVTKEKDELSATATEYHLQTVKLQSLCDDHAKTIDTLNDELKKQKDDLDSELVKLENMLRVKTDQLDGITEQYQANKVDMETMSAELDFARSQINELTSKMATQSEDVKYVQSELRASLERAGHLEAELNQLRASMSSAEMNALLLQQSEQIKALEQKEIELQKLTAVHEQLSSQFAQLKLKFDEQKHAFVETQSAFSEEREAHLKVKKQCADAENALNSSRQELEEMSATMAELEENFSKSSTVYDEQVAVYQELLERFNHTEQEKQTLDSKYSKLQEHAQSLSDQLQGAKGRIDELEIAISDAREKAARDMEAWTKEWQEQHGINASEFEMLGHRLEKVTKEYEQSNMEKSQEIKRLKEELQQLRGIHSDLDKIKESMQLEKQQIQASLQLAEDDNSALLEQLNEWMSLDMSVADVQQLKNQVELLKNNDMSTKYQRLHKQYSEKSKQLEHEQQRIKSIENQLNQLDQLQGQKKGLEHQLEFILSRNQHLEEENAKMVKHNNFKQKLQYHLQIKQENNSFRVENQKLWLEMEKLKKLDEISTLRKEVNAYVASHASSGAHTSPVKKQKNTVK